MNLFQPNMTNFRPPSEQCDANETRLIFETTFCLARILVGSTDILLENWCDTEMSLCDPFLQF